MRSFLIFFMGGYATGRVDQPEIASPAVVQVELDVLRAVRYRCVESVVLDI